MLGRTGKSVFRSLEWDSGRSAEERGRPLRALEAVIGRAADAPESGQCFLAILKAPSQMRIDARSRIREAVRAKYATSIHHIKIFRAMCDRGTDRAPA